MTDGRHFYGTGIRVGKHRATHLKCAETTDPIFKVYFKRMFKTQILSDRARRYASEHINPHLGSTRVSPAQSTIKN